MLNVEQIKLINLGLTIKKLRFIRENECVSEGAKMLCDTQIIKYEKEYFELRFEMNRGELEDKYIDYRASLWIDLEIIEKEIKEWVQFVEFCLEMCINISN